MTTFLNEHAELVAIVGWIAIVGLGIWIWALALNIRGYLGLMSDFAAAHLEPAMLRQPDGKRQPTKLIAFQGRNFLVPGRWPLLKFKVRGYWYALRKLALNLIVPIVAYAAFLWFFDLHPRDTRLHEILFNQDWGGTLLGLVFIHAIALVPAALGLAGLGLTIDGIEFDVSL